MTAAAPGRAARRAAPRADGRADRQASPGGVPWPLAVPAAAGLALLVLPLLALVLRAPWSRLPDVLADPEVQQALWLSVVTATAATVLSLVLGVPLAWLLARTRLPGRGLVRAVVTVPLVLPPVVGGVALLLLLGRNGLLGRPLDLWFGVTVPFSTAAVVLAQTFVALPFLVVSVDGALRTLDDRLERAASTLGASRLFTFRHVTLPLVLPGLAAGAVLCFARALGEFGATITFAGSLPGVTRTTPVAVYLFLETDPDAAVVLSLVLLTVSVTVLLLLRDRWLTVAR